MKFAYLYRFDPENPGDLYSSPMHYLGHSYEGVVVDVLAQDIPKMTVDAVIIGGGALFTNKKFLRNLNHKLEKITAKKRVVWGVGFDTNNIDVNIAQQFDLFGTREHKIDKNISWVPCSSCLHDIFVEKENTKPVKDFLVVDHFKRSIEFDQPHTRIINRPNSIRNIVEQIADHRFVVTSSYHVAYWSILMGRRCAIIGENLPSKFKRMKHFPVKASTWNDNVYDQAKTWPNARYESIKSNHKHFQNFEEVLNIEKPSKLLWMQYKHLKRDIT